MKSSAEGTKACVGVEIVRAFEKIVIVFVDHHPKRYIVQPCPPALDLRNFDCDTVLRWG